MTMARHVRRLSLTLVTFALVATAGCTFAASGEQGGSPDTVQVRTDLLEPLSPSPWRKYEVLDPLHLEFTFAMGTPDCYGIEVSVQEDEQQVAVGIADGAFPSKAYTSCEDSAFIGSTVVTLSSPLADRRVVDLNV